MGCHYFSHGPSVPRRLVFFQQHNISDLKISSWPNPLVSCLQLLQVFFTPPQPEFLRQMLYTPLFLQYKSSLLNSPGGGSTSLVFPVSSIPGDNGGAERGSLRVSTVRGLLLIVYSASQRKVRSNSSSRRLPCSLMSPFMTFLIDLICLSQTPTKLLADAGFLIQSMLSLRSYAFIF